MPQPGEKRAVAAEKRYREMDVSGHTHFHSVDFSRFPLLKLAMKTEKPPTGHGPHTCLIR